MKMTLQEAYERATKGPLTAGYGKQYCFHEGNEGVIVRATEESETDEGGEETVAEVWPTSGDTDRYDTALLAHAFNVLPEVVEALRRVEAHLFWFETGDGESDVDALPAAIEAITKASIVEVPE